MLQPYFWMSTARYKDILCAATVLCYVAFMLTVPVLHWIIGWKRPLRSSSPTIGPTPPCLLNHIPKCHIYTFFKHLQGWWLNHLPGQPVPILARLYKWCMRTLTWKCYMQKWERRRREGNVKCSQTLQKLFQNGLLQISGIFITERSLRKCNVLTYLKANIGIQEKK